MAPKRASKQQQQLNVDQFKLLKKPMDHLGKQINVPGSFWEGRMLTEERDKGLHAKKIRPLKNGDNRAIVLCRQR